MKAAGYVRVSTQEQAQNGWNLDEDRRLIREKCDANGWELVEIFDDGGRQGDDPSRPGLAALIDSLDELDVVILRSQDRISRDIGIWAVTSAALRSARVRVETFGGTLDLESPAGEFMANVMASVGKFEKRQIGQRVQQAMEARAKAGHHNGGPRPFGYVREEYRPDDGQLRSRLVPYESEAAVVRRIFAEYLAGKGQREIARDLNADGVAAQRGGTWHQGTIGRYLAKPLYKGFVQHRRTKSVYKGQHEPLVAPETWEKARQLREAQAHAPGGGSGRYPTGQFVFRKGHLRCGTCGEAMIPTTRQRGWEAYVCYRRMRHGIDACPQRPVRRELVDGAVWDYFSKVALDVDATVAAVLEQARGKVAEIDALQAHAEKEAVKAEARLTRIRAYFREGRISPEEWHEERDDLTADLEAAKAQVDRLEAQRSALLADVAHMDAEDVALRELARIRALIAGEAEQSRLEGIDAFRAALRRLFASFALVPIMDPPRLASYFVGSEPGTMPWQGEIWPALEGYHLMPHARVDAIDLDADEFPALHRVALRLHDNGSLPLVT